MNFCDKCNNMYFTKIIYNENNNSKKLIYRCRNCNNEEDVKQFCILKKVYNNSVSQDDIINFDDICYDPSIPHTTKITCNSCNLEEYQENDVIFFTYGENQKLMYICCNCKNKWSN